MSIIFKILQLLSITLLAGCSTNHIRENFKLERDHPKGVLMGSVSYSGMLSKYSIDYESLDTGLTGSVGAGSPTIFSAPKSSTKLPYINGSVFALELDPGRYVFNGWSVSSSMTFASERRFRIEVLVEAGRAIYMGNFHFNQTKSMGLIVAGADVYFENKFLRDELVLKKAYPLVPNVFNSNSSVDKVKLGGSEVGAYEVFLKALVGALGA